MTDDRFDDLGGNGRRSAGERLAERDRTHPEPGGRPEVPRPGNKYAWAVGILMVMGLGVLLFAQTLPNSGEGLEGPDPGSRLKAFAAPSDDVVNLCQLRRRPLVLTFIFDRGADCYPQVDRTERVRDDLPGVTFATVFFTSKERGEVRGLVESRRWRQPVAVDKDGAVANLYGVGGCPTTVFARAGGRVASTELGNLTESELRRRARQLSAG